MTSRKQHVSGDRRHFLATRYLDAKEAVIAAGYADEIDWQEDRAFDRIGERDFLAESAWVVLSAGMRETVVRAKFAELAPIFSNFESAEAISLQRSRTRRCALRIFNHVGKIDAIFEIAGRVKRDGFRVIKERVQADGIFWLQSFPYIGSVTVYHLAKNLGLDVVKPDRHLIRITKSAGYNSPQSLCDDIASMVSERISVIDVVLWRYATLHSEYAQHFSG